ncbi:Cof-type HAD-IIB family hydrolase [Lacticaseibacillus jixiensis]|uniref:Cof-type HAD-IIB family hydrolase n=1 Tax=Lacticaseibacillus jixiensis TaxID=3231926 RepID=UPI0036F20537
MIRHIFTDMDGTLLDSQGQLTATNAEKILSAKIPVTLVSARAPIEMAPAIDKLHLTGAQIAFNGGLIFLPDGGRFTPLAQTPLSHAAVRKLLTVIARDFPKVSLSYYDRSHWYTARIDDGIKYEQSLTEQAPQLIVKPADTANALHIFKIMLITFNEAEMEALEQALTALAMPEIAVQRSGGAYLEITAKAAKKSTGIQYVLEHLHLRREETAAFGDGHNDLPMLEAVGTPIAMANAHEDVKKVCTYITDGNDEDGVGVGILRWLKD